jgi:diguanylate cyclase (GGDEF)-like protein
MTDDAVFRPERSWRADAAQLALLRRSLMGPVPWASLDEFLRVLGLAPRREGEDVVHAFCALVRRARTPVEVRRGLTRLAWRLTAARRVVLLLETPHQRRLRMAACWPEPRLVRSARPLDPQDSTLSMISTPEGAHVPRSEAPQAGPRLRRPLSFHGEVFGSLLVYGGPELAQCSRRLLRRLDTLCDIAATAERAWSAEMTAAEMVPPIHDPLTGLHHASFLDAFLVHALALARRRRDDLTLAMIAPDRLAEVRSKQGPEIADAVLQRVARAVGESLRVSDVVARLDRDRLAAVMPSASAEDAVRVARQIVRTVAEAGLTAPTHPPVTASVGIASFPDHADTPEALREAATQALAQANQHGPGTIATYQA